MDNQDLKPKNSRQGPRERKRAVELHALNETNRIISERFRAIRLQAGLTQAEFADTLQVGIPYIKGVEQGRFAPTHEVIARVAKDYKRSVDWIYGLKDY